MKKVKIFLVGILVLFSLSEMGLIKASSYFLYEVDIPLAVLESKQEYSTVQDATEMQESKQSMEEIVEETDLFQESKGDNWKC